MIFLWKNNLYRDFIITFIVLVSPFLFYLYRLVPKDSYQWETNFFTFDARFLESNIQDVFWYLNYKVFFIILLSIWYLTCKHKWRLLILVPFFIEFHKLIGYFFSLENNYLQYKMYYSLIISIPVVLLLTYISVSLKYHSFKQKINQQLDNEIDALIDKASNFNQIKYRELKFNLIQLRKEKKRQTKIEYLTKLIKLREEYSVQE